MYMHRIFKKSCKILATVSFFLLLGAGSGAAADKDVLVSKIDYSGDSSFINRSNQDGSGKYAFVDGDNLLDINDAYPVELLSSYQANPDETTASSSQYSVNSQPQHINLGSVHKYLGYATAALAGITAATSSSGGIHQAAGYTTAGLSLITTAIGFYEYGEYIDLDEGFTGYNTHMILESLATIGFIATAAIQNENSAHAVIGGVSTAMMILPIFVVHW